MTRMRSPTAGDASAWLDEHGDALYRYARSRVGHREAAEDLVQDALLAALQSRDRFQGQATVRTWLLSILRHKIVDHLPPRGEVACRRPKPIRSRGPTPFARGISAPRVSGRRPSRRGRLPDQTLEDREFWDVLDRCLSRLPHSLSAVFILRELEDLDTAELRRILELSEGNLRVRLHRARLLLRECLEKHWFVETPGGSRRPE